MNELWQDIPNFEGYYQASTFGRIRSVERDICDINGHWRHRKSVILKAKKNKYGYYCVLLCKENIHYHYNIHRLIALTFFKSELSPKQQINHIDGDKSNNSIHNLEIVSALENRHHAIRMGLWNQSGENSKKAKISNSQAKEIRFLYHTHQLTCKELSDRFNLALSSIRRVVNFKSYK